MFLYLKEKNIGWYIRFLNTGFFIGLKIPRSLGSTTKSLKQNIDFYPFQLLDLS